LTVQKAGQPCEGVGVLWQVAAVPGGDRSLSISALLEPRAAGALGHTVWLMPPSYVKPYLNLLSTVCPTSYGTLLSFLIPAADFGASNTFRVIVQNDPCDCSNPTGLLVSADVSAVPLPGRTSTLPPASAR
jgi:hypothetical protein